MEHYSTRLRCTNCGKVFVREFEKGSVISENTEPCPVCNTLTEFEVVADETMTALDGRQILHG